MCLGVGCRLGVCFRWTLFGSIGNGKVPWIVVRGLSVFLMNCGKSEKARSKDPQGFSKAEFLQFTCRSDVPWRGLGEG